jgi:hypothetical protein
MKSEVRRVVVYYAELACQCLSDEDCDEEGGWRFKLAGMVLREVATKWQWSIWPRLLEKRR